MYQFMHTLVLRNLFNKPIEITHPDKNVLFHIQLAAVDWMHACGGKGRCTTCRFRVVEGMQNISHHSPAEQKYRHQGRLSSNERLTCQITLSGDVVAEVPQACKLPHITYS
jgi:2Fe-2S ferredoxin